MAEDIARIVAQADLPAIVGTLTAVKAKGNEFVAKCWFHSPDNNPSLSLYQKNGKWNFKCFSCGEAGDALDWIQKVEGLDASAALKRLNGGSQWTSPKLQPVKPAKKPERVTSKPPADAPAPDMKIARIGEPSRVWCYRDADGGVLGYVARYETAEGKEIRPWTWGSRDGDNPGWAPSAWSKPRPLYGLDRLAAHPNRPVVIPEGEKACDAAQVLLNEHYVSITWPGGANAWHAADWSPLAGKTVLLWPDNDAAGIECMQKLAALLAAPRGLACKVKIIDPNRMPEGFDAADWTGTTEELIAWAKPRASVYVPQGGVGAETPPPLAAATPPAAVPDGDRSAPPGGEGPPQRKKPRLAVVDGNTALAPDAEQAVAPVALSEDHIAAEFADQHSQDWRYVKRWEKWFHWDGFGWVEDTTAEVFDLSRQICREACYWPEAVKERDDFKRKISRKATAGNVRDIAGADRRIAATVEQWDANPWVLGIPAGAVDLRTGEIIAPRREDYITKRAAVNPERAEHPMWDKVVARAANGDPTMARYLQKWAGYMLTGDTREEAFLFVHGPGGSGKSTFVQAIRDVMGSYAKSTRIETFMSSRGQEHPTEIADLAGARLVYAPETEEGARWNESRIKMLTGRDRVKARFVSRDYFEFDPVCKIMIFGNHRPRLHSVGEEMRRRIHLVEFPDSIPADQRDHALKERIRAEYPAILQWMVEGAIAWQAEGLGRPQAVTQATDDYLSSQDTLGAWLEECCERKSGARCQVSGAYRNYERWAKERGEYVPSVTVFSEKMQSRGFEKRKISVMHFIGLELKTPDAPPFAGYDIP